MHLSVVLIAYNFVWGKENNGSRKHSLGGEKKVSSSTQKIVVDNNERNEIMGSPALADT